MLAQKWVSLNWFTHIFYLTRITLGLEVTYYLNLLMPLVLKGLLFPMALKPIFSVLL
jgi:hypothetical protein